MTALGSWVGTGAGVVMVGACFIVAMFASHLPSFTRQWIDRLLIVGVYLGATAVLYTAGGQLALGLANRVAGFFGGFGSGLGHAAIVLAGLFLLLAFLVAVIKAPNLGAMSLALLLAFTLALVPGGFLHHFYVVTAVPGQQYAAQFAAWLGG
jgi:hypothetical protein